MPLDDVPPYVHEFLNTFGVETKQAGWSWDEVEDLWNRLIAAGQEVQANGCDCALAVRIDLDEHDFHFLHFPPCALVQRN